MALLTHHLKRKPEQRKAGGKREKRDYWSFSEKQAQLRSEFLQSGLMCIRDMITLNARAGTGRTSMLVS